MLQTKKTLWTDAERRILTLPDEQTVSQWADDNRVLDARSSAEPGQWRTSRTPYLRGIMDVFGDDEVEELTIQKPAQSGGTESIYNMLGYCISYDPGPALLVMPRDEDCDYAGENRLKPMLRNSRDLAEHITDRLWDLSKREFNLDNMTLYFAGSNSPAGLKAKPIRYLFLDEVNAYPPFAGKDTNPVDLAKKRTITFWDRKIVMASTPTTVEGLITLSYKCSNMQQYYVPCPECGRYQVLLFSQLKLPKNLRDPDKIRRSEGAIYYECEHCSARIEENAKEQMTTAGVWVPKGQSVALDGRLTGRPERDKRHSGFQFNALLNPWLKWTEIMALWFEANTEEGIAVGKLLDFKNNILGEAFEETGRKIKTSELVKLRGGFSKGTVPADCIALVASVDYHKSKTRGIVRIDYEVRGFGYGMKNYVISSGSMTSFDELDKEVLMSPFPWSDGTPNEAKLWLAAMVLFVDSGYESDDVYEYCRKRPGLTIPTRGETGPCMKPLRPSDLESATERRLNRRQRVRYRGMQLLLVDTHFFKNQVTSWVEAKRDEDGKIITEALTLFYDEIPEYYFKEFGNEQLVKVRDTKGNVRWVWQPVTRGAPTHSLDTAVLCAAAAYYKGLQYLRKPEEKKAGPTAGPQRRKRRPRGGFLSNLPKL